MTSTFLRAGTAMVLVLASVPAAQAATCTVVGSSITCTEPLSDPIASDLNDVTVTIDAGASVDNADDSISAIALGGDNATVINNGDVNQNADDEYAITGAGSGLTVQNTGNITSGDRGIEMIGGENLTVINSGTITSVRQAVRSGVPGATVQNTGTITASEGRAVQVRGNGVTIVNDGQLIGGEEVVEGRGDFNLTNNGTIRLIDPAIEDEDGVQFAGGMVLNTGSITGSDDGIDLDEGVVTNTAGATILSTGPGSSGIDIDEVYEDLITVRQNTTVTVNNAGLIEGNFAIGADEAATNDIVIENSGTLRGRSGTSLNMAPGQGVVTVALLEGSVIEGDASFGSSNDMVLVDALFSGSLINAGGTFWGSDGEDTFAYEGTFDFGDITAFAQDGDTVSLAFTGEAGPISGIFNSFEFWSLGGETYSTSDVAARVGGGMTPVPLPAGFALLLTALGGLAVARRRAA